jgi:acyl-CoA thioesterase
LSFGHGSRSGDHATWRETSSAFRILSREGIAVVNIQVVGVTPFSEVLAHLTPDGHSYCATPSEAWRQGRTFFGGLSAALAVTAAQQAFPALPLLRSAQFTFIGPVTGPLEMTPRLVRAGKSASFVEIIGRSQSEDVFRAMLLFGAPRESGYSHQALPMPLVPPPDGLPDFFDSPFAPRCTGQFEGRTAGGAKPISGARDPELLLWMRHRDSSAPNDVRSILSLGDVPPPAAITMFTARAPISTVTWAVDIIGTQFQGAAWHLAHVEAETIGAGYSSQRITLWNRDGEPVLSGRQTIAVFG